MAFSETDVAGIVQAVLPSRIVLRRSDSSNADGGHDWAMHLADDSTAMLELRWAGEGFPRDIEHALVRPTRPNTHLVLVARRMSSGARENLADRGVSWAAADGTAFLEIGPVIVDRSFLQPVKATRKASPQWNDSQAAVAEIMLADAVMTWPAKSHRAPGVAELSTRSGRSLGGVSAALQIFDRRGWTAKTAQDAQVAGAVSSPPRSTRALLEPAAMLDSWVDYVRARPTDWRAFHFLERDIDVTADLLAHHFAGLVLFTGHWAASKRVPRLTRVPRLRCWISDELPWNAVEHALGSLGGRPAENGRLVLARGGPAVMRSARSDSVSPSAAPPRIYADMGLDETERGRDAAELYRRKVMSF